jgi:hypothetical protein
MKKKILIYTLFALSFTACKKDVPSDGSGGTGLKPNTISSIEKVDEADIDEDGTALPAKFILNGPAIGDQGQTSKCVAYSAAYYIIGMYNGSTAMDLDKSGSPDFLYGQYKKINNDNNCSEGCYLFNDDANNIKGAAEILLNFGTTSWNQLPTTSENACSVISPDLITQATSNKIKDYYRLDKTEYTDVMELKNWLYAGYPLWMGVTIDDGFQKLKAGEVWSKASGKTHGGHAMVIVGYDDAKNAFKIANSWGSDWAEEGYGWVDYDYFIKLLKEDGAPEIGILIPNDIQRINMSKVSPIACGNANWGDITINNSLAQEIAIEMTGVNNYNNNEMGNIDTKEAQFFTKIPQGAIKVKILTANKSAILKEYTVNVTSCKEVVLDVN